MPNGIEGIPSKKMVLMEKVNAVAKKEQLGIDELTDIVAAIYDAWEEIASGSSFFTIAMNLSLPIISAVTGAQMAWHELHDLQDEEIKTLVDLSNNYKLGDDAPKARLVVKLLLTGFQTYSVFRKKVE